MSLAFRKSEAHRNISKWANYDDPGLFTSRCSSVCFICCKLFKPSCCLLNWSRRATCFFSTLLSEPGYCNSDYYNWAITKFWKRYILQSGTPSPYLKRRNMLIHFKTIDPMWKYVKDWTPIKLILLQVKPVKIEQPSDEKCYLKTFKQLLANHLTQQQFY